MYIKSINSKGYNILNKIYDITVLSCNVSYVNKFNISLN